MPKYMVRREIVEQTTVDAADEEEAELESNNVAMSLWDRNVKLCEVTEIRTQEDELKDRIAAVLEHNNAGNLSNPSDRRGIVDELFEELKELIE